MGFGDLTKESGVKALDDYLLTRSYIEGYQPSKADTVVFDALGKAPVDKYVCASRWYNHIKSFGDQRKKFPGQAKDVSSYGSSAPAKAAATKDEDDDDIDFFESEDEDEAEKRRAERVAAYSEKKKDKKQITAKSMIILDIKPWDDETDMNAMEEAVRSIKTDGLVWGTSKLVPVAFGIKKLQITCVVEDDKVGTDFLEEEISKFEDYVQSIDIAAFNKL
ncbi:unnamed protein product [Dibothriocephalus latus]|uniref:Translation elongation factor EF1B beta/delta subunit guanine nucleotide exchange domain-containing protein n=1 Tax=Dibothriocephalus latus TaxID=60516 RepID=A0A3P7L5Z7_DIBLA|nr:unnamed protein product [Dibothriocephalus latus]